MSQAVVHLDGSLGVAHVEDFVDACRLLDCLDVCDVVVKTHLDPGVVPVGGVSRSIESFVALTVLSATIVANPNIVACIGELERPW